MDPAQHLYVYSNNLMKQKYMLTSKTYTLDYVSIPGRNNGDDDSADSDDFYKKFAHVNTVEIAEDFIKYYK